MIKRDKYILRGLLIFICFLSLVLSFGKNIFSVSTKDLKASTKEKNNIIKNKNILVDVLYFERRDTES